MNTFSNSLFTLLFGWARSLIEGIWNAAAEGKFSGFFVWLGDHWLILVVLLCLICTAADFLIWMIRWRPYLVWRTKLRRLARRLRGEKVDSQRRFSQGYRDAVVLDLSPQDVPGEGAQEAAAFPWQQEEASVPVYQAPPEPLPEEYMPLPPVEASPVPEQQPVYPAYQPAPTPEDIYGPTFVPEPPYPENDPQPRRKRRSEKYDRPRPSWHERLTASDDDDEGMLDGLPPAVDRQQAFHEPVYPAQQGVYTGWRRPTDEQ